jgi:hypothetical protein
MSDHSPAHDTANPMAVPQNGNIPAGWVSAEQHEAQQRQMLREQIAREQQDAVNAAVEAEVNKRMNTAVKAEDVTEDEVNNGE